jgi:hypothetical protein
MLKMQRSKIEALQRKLAAGKLVSKRDIENVLGSEWLARYEQDWAAEKAARASVGHALRDKQAVKQALLASAIAELDAAENTPEALAQRVVLREKLKKLMADSR